MIEVLSDWLVYDVSGHRIGLVLGLATFVTWLLLQVPLARRVRRVVAALPWERLDEVQAGVLRIALYCVLLYVPTGLLALGLGGLGYQGVRFLLALELA